MKPDNDSLLCEWLQDFGLVSCGLELGNWYGFCGVPMGTGLASFVQVESAERRASDFRLSGRMRMRRLDLSFTYESAVGNGDCAETILTIAAREPTLLGDIVLHLVFDGIAEPCFQSRALVTPRRYHYTDSNAVELQVRPGKRLQIRTELKCEGQEVNLAMQPYAALIGRGRLRYHTRALCFGGADSRLLLRSRGALNCIDLGRAPAWTRSLLYRGERRAPRLLPNTQLCAASTMPERAVVQLRHVVTRL